MGVQERREKEREQRRIAILDAAKALYTQLGLEGVSMDRIAQQAELAKGTIYLYFKSREEMMMALISHEMEHLLQALEQVAASDLTPQQQLIDAVKAFHELSQSSHFFYRIMMQVNITHVVGRDHERSVVAEQFAQQNRRMFEVILGIVQRGVDRGAFHLAHPPQYVVAQMMLSIKGAMVILTNDMMPPMFPGMPPLEQLLSDIARLLIRGLEHRPAEGTPTT
ncbi:MAG: TetR/AcrR family transcriptional regulator [Candidatus Kapabacteria bacterium]|nr:TetR/AcrR family transcriptional regulator [Candidatus Kapabacteria bacterium]